MLPFIFGLAAFGAAATAVAVKAPGSNSGAASSSNLSYEFTAAHKEVQRRIDDILGAHFASQEGRAIYNWRGNGERWLCTFNDDTFVGERLRWCSDNGGQTWSGSHHTGPSPVSVVQPYIGGWKDVNGMHYANADEAMQGIFGEATSGGYNPNMTAPDTYKAYSYPSPAVAAKYGNNLGYFVRCAPEELTCQWFGKTISLKQILTIVGSAVATIATAGAGIVALATAITGLAASLSNTLFHSKDVDTMTHAASELINIYNGAAIEVRNGTHEDVFDIAKNFVDNHPQIFEQQ